jgi:hypothetical protein
VAVYSGTCKSPGRPSQVYVPIRSSLMTPNNSPTICSTYVPHGLGDDTLGCVAVYTAPSSCGGPPFRTRGIVMAGPSQPFRYTASRRRSSAARSLMYYHLNNLNN